MLAKIGVITLQHPDSVDWVVKGSQCYREIIPGQDGEINIQIRIHPNEDIGECYKFIVDMLESNGILIKER